MMRTWISLYWFTPETLQGFLWSKPYFLYFIPAVPLLFILRWLLHRSFRQRLGIALTRQRLKSSWGSHLRYVPPGCMMLTIMGILLALARPQRVNERVAHFSEGIDILLVLDISASMLIEDFSPNRLEAAKQVAREFVRGRFQDRIGIVLFAGDAYSLCPLTTDYGLLTSYIDEIRDKLIQTPGTAIGSALAVAVNRMNESFSKSKVVILLSDGDNTAGSIDPIMAAQLANAHNIKLYTIAVGREGRVRLPQSQGGEWTENTVDETTLRKVAEIGEGRFYRASGNDALQRVFRRINRYEKAEIKETRFRDISDLYPVYLRWAILFFLLWLLCKNTFMGNILED